MKKALSPLIILTIIFFAVMIGYLLGNNQGGFIRVSVPDSMLTYPTELYVSELQAAASPTSTAAPIETVPLVTGYVSFPLNINVSSKEDLMLLPGIGEKLSQRIVDYRRKNGRFSSVDELVNIPGISHTLLESIRDQITVGG